MFDSSSGPAAAPHAGRSDTQLSRLSRATVGPKALHFGASLLAAAVLCACAHYEPMPLDPSANVEDLGQRSLEDPSLSAFVRQVSPSVSEAWPPAAWGLTELTLVGLFFHPDLDVARAAWDVARASQKTAAQRPNPSLTVTPTYSVTTSIPSPWIVTSFLSIPIETAGKRKARMSQTAAQTESARYHVAQQAWQIRDRVRRSLISLQVAIKSHELLKAQQSLQVENQRRMSEQMNVGAVSSFELMQARLSALTSLLALRDAERSMSQARIALANAIGILPDALDKAVISEQEMQDTPAAMDELEARTRALTNRADILAGLSDYAASEAALRLEIANQYPDLHLAPGYTFNMGDHRWSLGLWNTMLPVLNQNQGPIAVAEAHRREAAARFLAQQFLVINNVARAHAAYESALQKHADADAIVADSEEKLRQAEAQMSVGALSQADLVATRLQLSNAAVARLGVTAEVQLALSDLENAIQSPLLVPPQTFENSPERQQPSHSTHHDKRQQ